MNRLVITLCCLTLVLTACTEESTPVEKSEKRERLVELTPAYKNAASYEKQIQRIDSDQKLYEAKSLSYIDNDGNIESVTALVDSTLKFSKLIHYLTETDGRQVETNFYYKGSQLFSSVQTTKKFMNNTTFSREEKVYYDAKSEVVYTAQRKASGENDILFSPYSKAENRMHNPTKTLDIINQNGKFQTNFLGFNESRDKIFLNVGTEYYNSSVVVGSYFGLLKTLKNYEKKYLNKSLKIEFKEVTELDGFTYQALLNIKLR